MLLIGFPNNKYHPNNKNYLPCLLLGGGGGLVLGRRDYYQYCTSPEKQKTSKNYQEVLKPKSKQQGGRNPSSRARGATPMAATSIPHPTSPPDPLDAVPSARAAPAPPGHRPISGRATRSHDPRGWVSRSTWLASAGDLGKQHSIQMLLGLTTQSFSVYKKEWEKKLMANKKIWEKIRSKPSSLQSGRHANRRMEPAAQSAAPNSHPPHLPSAFPQLAPT